MTQSFWLCDWAAKAREMDLAENDIVISIFQEERNRKLIEMMRNKLWGPTK